jgi:hypothetical protein
MKTLFAKQSHFLAVLGSCVLLISYTSSPQNYACSPQTYRCSPRTYNCSPLNCSLKLNLRNLWLKNLCGSLCNSVAKFRNDKTNPKSPPAVRPSIFLSSWVLGFLSSYLNFTKRTHFISQSVQSVKSVVPSVFYQTNPKSLVLGLFAMVYLQNEAKFISQSVPSAKSVVPSVFTKTNPISKHKKP